MNHFYLSCNAQEYKKYYFVTINNSGMKGKKCEFLERFITIMIYS